MHNWCSWSAYLGFGHNSDVNSVTQFCSMFANSAMACQQWIGERRRSLQQQKQPFPREAKHFWQSKYLLLMSLCNTLWLVYLGEGYIFTKEPLLGQWDWEPNPRHVYSDVSPITVNRAYSQVSADGISAWVIQGDVCGCLLFKKLVKTLGVREPGLSSLLTWGLSELTPKIPCCQNITKAWILATILSSWVYVTTTMIQLH